MKLTADFADGADFFENRKGKKALDSDNRNGYNGWISEKTGDPCFVGSGKFQSFSKVFFRGIVMKLKTATLISLIGISLNFVLFLTTFLFQAITGCDINPQFNIARVIISALFFNGSLILFLFVLYKKQKD